MPAESTAADIEGSFSIVEHTADWAITIRAPDLQRLFIVAAKGMNSLILDDPELASLDVTKEISLSAFDAESLLVDWLGELAFWAETEQLIFRRFSFKQFEKASLVAVISGAKVGLMDKHIKAVTYHGLKVLETESGLEATVIFDV